MIVGRCTACPSKNRARRRGGDPNGSRAASNCAFRCDPCDGHRPDRRTWRYPVDAIEGLTGEIGDTPNEKMFFLRPASGGVKFDYKDKSVFLAPGVDDAEGEEIADWLAKRLPRSASSFG